MTKKEVIKKFDKPDLSEAEQIEIFNWYIKNESPEITCTLPTANPLVTGTKVYRLSEQEITTANRPQSAKLLEYSIKKIKEYLDIK